MTSDERQDRPLDDSLADGATVAGTGHRAFWIGLIFVLLSVIWGLATYFILTNLTPITPSDEVVVFVLFINVLLILAMFAVLGWQVLGLWGAWRRRIPGARI